MPTLRSFLISDLLREYRGGNLTPTHVIEEAMARADDAPERHVWIGRRTREDLLQHARAIEERSIDELPLYGIPFVIKDNIDLADVPTTAGCPAYSYTPARSARVVQRLLDAGAIPLGKTNLDQFATGLVGTRSPYGACRNSFHPDFISGGSSSGSAVAVATGLSSFSLGTDTAGSGRIPAAFNNIVGLKPSLGRVSTRGVVPACRSLDCVSIFALTAEDAAAVLAVGQGFDDEDPFSRRIGDRPLSGRRFGVPQGGQLQFFGDREYARLFDQAIARVESLGGTIARMDFAPFLEAARLLYDGPWVAERYAAIEEFIHRRADAVHPVTRQVIEKSTEFSAADAFKGMYRLEALKRASEHAWESIDVLLTPTAGTVYEIARVEADPIRLNTNLGYYTNFMNLLDLAGVAVPAGFRSDGLPFGITLVGRGGTEAALLEWAGRLQRASVRQLGALDLGMPSPPTTGPESNADASSGSLSTPRGGFMSIAVCGAHMAGLPLNHQLLERGGRMVKRARTAARYRLFALPGEPARPGLVRDSNGGGSIELEIWIVRSAELGSLVESIPAPLGLGKIELQDGETVTGFVCESHGTHSAVEITALGGWRAYLASTPERRTD